MSTIWLLLIFVPNEAAGRQVGPFATQAQCIAAQRIYNERQYRYIGPQSACIEAAKAKE